MTAYPVDLMCSDFIQIFTLEQVLTLSFAGDVFREVKERLHRGGELSLGLSIQWWDFQFPVLWKIHPVVVPNVWICGQYGIQQFDK